MILGARVRFAALGPKVTAQLAGIDNDDGDRKSSSCSHGVDCVD